jgi:uncharacterized membrane protein
MSSSIDMPQNTRERDIRLLFYVSVGGKGLISFFEVVAGVTVLFIAPTLIAQFLNSIAQSELTHEPNNLIAKIVVDILQNIDIPSSIFIAVYLLSRGIVKLGLVAALLKEQLWAYPASIFVLGCFILYQLYQIVATHSLAIVGLTLFDLVVVWSIWAEWNVLKKHLAGLTPTTLEV